MRKALKLQGTIGGHKQFLNTGKTQEASLIE